MTRLERTLLSHRVAYGIELLCVHASWMHDNLYGENHQLAVEAHGRAKAVWTAIDEAMETLGADLRRAEAAIGQFAAEYRAERGGELRRSSGRGIFPPSGYMRQAGAPSTVSSQVAPKLQEAS